MLRYASVVSALGNILLIIGISMLLPLLCSAYYGEGHLLGLLAATVITISFGFSCSYFFKTPEGLTRKESYMVVALGWIAAALFGTLPYLFGGTFGTFSDAFFETMSGFTTTGASVLTDVEVVPKSILLWRSLTHWLGGMGIMVLFVAIMSHVGVGAIQVFRAESPGPTAKKLRPRIKDTAKTLWYTYLALTIAEILLLWAVGMELFDSVCHTFGTLATGGFSTKNQSIGFYGPAVQWVVTVFMFLGGTNFGLMYMVFRGRSIKELGKSEEFRMYIFIVASAAAALSFFLHFFGELRFIDAVRVGAFQIVSIITTTGYSTADFAAWPYFAQALLVVLMFVGGSNGSTGGSIKVGRHLVLLKNSLIQIRKVIYPREIITLKIDGRAVEQPVLLHILHFFFLYMLISAAGLAVISSMGVDFTTAFTSVAACLGNVGPGLAAVGPAQNYSFMPPLGKFILSFLMLVGRLEIYTVLILFLPSTWKK